MDLNYISVLMSLFLSSEAIQVISSSSEAYLPPLRGQAEILNSSLEGLKEVTLCARFNTDQFLFLPDRPVFLPDPDHLPQELAAGELRGGAL